ncbi:MAG: hypothetical protein R2713_14105 [Ilumatobacteraceae bacterium]
MATIPPTTGPAARPFRVSWRAADSPTRLRLATAATVLVGIALSIGGWYAIDRRDTAIDDAAAAAAQLIQVQDVRVQVVQADSIASNAYLLGGQEAPELRAAYDDRIDDAGAGLSRASGDATETDEPLLGTAVQQFARYVGLVEQARANNRQGFPVGAAYQRQARTVASELAATLQLVEQNTRQRVDDSMSRAYRASWLLVVTALLALAALLVGSAWLSRDFRRLLNVPLVVAALIAFLVLTVGVGTNARAAGRAGDAVREPLSAADLVAQARVAAFDARSSEALTLINRGNGAAYEQQWQLSASIADIALERACDEHGVGCGSMDDFDAYAASHAEVRLLDDGGDWDDAVDLRDLRRAGHRLRRRGRHDRRRARRAGVARPGPVRPCRRRARPAADRRRAGRPRDRRARRDRVRPATEGVPMRRFVAVALAVVAGAVAAGCSGDARLPDEVQGSVVEPTVVPTTAPPSCSNAEAAEPATRTYAPLDEQPAPGEMPAGSTMAEIAERGQLVVGVSGDTLLFGSRNPLTDTIEGFDISVVQEVAKAIFDVAGEGSRTGSSTR